MVYAAWAAVVAETPTAARLVRLGTAKRPYRPDDFLQGTETPDLATRLRPQDSLTARVAGGEYRGDDGKIYLRWDGKPQRYDHAD